MSTVWATDDRAAFPEHFDATASLATLRAGRSNASDATRGQNWP